MLRKLNKKQLLIGSVPTTRMKSFGNNSMVTIIVSLRYFAPGGLHPPSPNERNHTKPFFRIPICLHSFYQNPFLFIGNYSGNLTPCHLPFLLL